MHVNGKDHQRRRDCVCFVAVKRHGISYWPLQGEEGGGMWWISFGDQKM